MTPRTHPRHELTAWVIEALEELGGEGAVVDVSRVVWRLHEADLRASGDLFYTWQYDIRWAATELRKAGRLVAASDQDRNRWRLQHRSSGGP